MRRNLLRDGSKKLDERYPFKGTFIKLFYFFKRKFFNLTKAVSIGVDNVVVNKGGEVSESVRKTARVIASVVYASI